MTPTYTPKPTEDDVIAILRAVLFCNMTAGRTWRVMQHTTRVEKRALAIAAERGWVAYWPRRTRRGHHGWYVTGSGGYLLWCIDTGRTP